MNHLRDLMDKANTSGLVFPDWFNEELCQDTLRVTAGAAEEAVCFFVGSESDVSGLKVVPEISRLPYDVCWFEWTNNIDGREVLIGSLCWKKDDDIRGQTFVRVGGAWQFIFFWGSIAESGKLLVYYGHEQQPNESSIRFYQNSVCIIRVFLTAIACSNVKKIEHKQPEKLQSARAKRGKKPLFSYWTLELKPDRTESDPLGGTHSPPRLHLRRGHARQYAQGKWTWVQPCIVGNKSEGMVHKDYALA
jgi:hypothetical protein